MIYLLDDLDLKNDNLYIFYFYGSWMPYHTKMTAMISKMEEKFLEYKIYAVDVDHFKKMTQILSVNVIPTVLFYKKKEIARIEGVCLTSAFRKFFSDIYDQGYHIGDSLNEKN